MCYDIKFSNKDWSIIVCIIHHQLQSSNLSNEFLKISEIAFLEIAAYLHKKD